MEDCPFCEKEAERRELEENDDYPEEADREAERYEKWLMREGG